MGLKESLISRPLVVAQRFTEKAQSYAKSLWPFELLSDPLCNSFYCDPLWNSLKFTAMKTKVILQGGGEHARVVLDCLLSQHIEVCGLFDPKYSGELFGVKQLGQYDSSFEPDAKAIVAIGRNDLRKKVVQTTQHQFTSCTHDSVIFSSRAAHGDGCMILHGVIVQAQTVIGNHVILNTRAQIDHDCIIGDYVHIAPGAILCGTVQVGEGALIGAGAIILPGRKVGNWAAVGAGAVVTRDIPDHAIVVGNPATPVNKK